MGITVPPVAVVIVTYNGCDDTLECLESLSQLTYPRYAILLVDNASTDGTPARVRERFPDVQVIENRENLGFTGGNNVGIRAALAGGAEFVFLLNPDTRVAPDLLSRLVPVYALAKGEGGTPVGALGPLMLYADQPETIWSGGGQLDTAGRSTHRGHGESAPAVVAVEGRFEPCDFVAGCGLLLRRDVIQKVGLLDDRFFLYYEEVDLCKRVAAAGYAVGVAPEARLWHKVSRATGLSSPLTTYYMHRNQLLFLQKHGGAAGQRTALREAFRLLVVWTLKRNPRRRVLQQALADFRAGRFGKCLALHTGSG